MDYHFEADLNFDEVEIDNFIANCEQIIDEVTQNKNSAFKLKVAVHELVVNSVEHGYKKTSGKVSFSLKKEFGKIYLNVVDCGKGFDFDALALDKKATCLDEINPRGWGLLIINRLVEKLDVEQIEPSGTRVTITVDD
jgi:anti-sigma regulatory factor (Ser/Thr protein kinase)